MPRSFYRLARLLAAMRGGWLLVGAVCGLAIAFALAPSFRGLFSVPTGGVGIVTVAGYPKGFDYFVVALIVCASGVAAVAAGILSGLGGRSREAEPELPPRGSSRRIIGWAGVPLVAVLMFVVHDHPNVTMDMFHEGEQLTPAYLLSNGARPYADIFFLHGFAADGGIHALVLGDPPSPLRTRRLETILSALTLSLLALIAAEVCRTWLGGLGAIIAAASAMAAGQLPVFPFFRLAPLLLATWLLLRFVRLRSAGWLIGAAAASSFGILWSLDTGIYATVGTLALTALAALGEGRRFLLRVVPAVVATIVAVPLFLLLVTRADVGRFVSDSFVVIPGSIDAIWSLPAPAVPLLRDLAQPQKLLQWIESEPARYFLPPAFYGLLLAFALRAAARGDRTGALQLAAIALMSILVFRSASGRVGWGHTRFGVPLLGIAIVAYGIEPLFQLRGRQARGIVARVLLLALAIVGAYRYLEVTDNVSAAAGFVTGWPARLQRGDLVPYESPGGSGIYTNRQNAAELAALYGYSRQIAQPGQPMFDLSGERALYYFLRRPPSVRCPDVAMLSAPRMLDEALDQLDERRPAFVVLEGEPVFSKFDGVSNRDRVPSIARWVDANYPERHRIGRFLVAVPAGTAPYQQ